MSKTQDPILLKFRSSKKEGIKSGASSAANDAYLSGLNALGDELAALHSDEPFLNSLEKISVSALIAYVAYDKGVGEDVVLTLVANRFGAGNVENIYKKDYDDIIRYLVDLDPRKAMN